MPLRTFKLPHIPFKVATGDMHSNGLLLSDTEIEAVKKKLSDLPDGRYRKNEFVKEMPEKRYGIIKSNGQYFAVFRGLKHKSEISFHDQVIDPTTTPEKTIILTKIKVIQNLDTKEFGVMKVIIDHSQTAEQAAIKAKEVEIEYQNLVKLGKAIGPVLLRDPDQSTPQKRYFLFMKFEPGFNLKIYNSLKKEVTENGKKVKKFVDVPTVRMVEIVIKMLEKVKELHDNGMLHCDLKLENFVYDQTNNEINLVDWATAISVDASGNGFQSPLRGTDVHIPPEHFDRYNSLAMELKSKNKAANGSYLYNEATEMHSIGVAIQMLLNFPIYEKGSPGESVPDPVLYQEGAAKIFADIPAVVKFLYAMTTRLAKENIYEVKEMLLAGTNGHANGNHANGMQPNGVSVEPIKTKLKVLKAIHLKNLRPTFVEAIEFFKQIHEELVAKTHLHVAIVDLTEFTKYYSKKGTDRNDRLGRYRALLMQADEVCIINKTDCASDPQSQRKHYIMMLQIQNMIMQKRLICMPEVYFTPNAESIAQVPAEIAAKAPYGSSIRRSYVYLDGSTYDIEHAVITENDKSAAFEQQDADAAVLKSHDIQVIRIANHKTKTVYQPEMRAFKTLLENAEYLALISELQKLSDTLDYQYGLTTKAEPLPSFINNISASIEIRVAPQTFQDASYRYEQLNKAITKIKGLYSEGTLSKAIAQNILNSLKADVKFVGSRSTSSIMQFFTPRPAPVAKIADLATTLGRRR